MFELERLHKELHSKPLIPQYTPTSVIESLKTLNRYLKSAMSLGIYSFISSDTLAARHIINLEKEIDGLAYQILIHTSLTVGRNVHKALGALPLYMYLVGIDKITDSFKDLAYLTLTEFSPQSDIYKYFVSVSDILTTRFTYKKEKEWTIEDLVSEYAVDIIAILRGGRWLLSPSLDIRLHEEDAVYISGLKGNVNDLLRDMNIEMIEGKIPPPEVEQLMKDIDSMTDIINLLNDLAHYQLQSQDPMMVDEVLEMEMFVDTLRLRLSENIMSTKELSQRDKFALLMLVTRLEDIADAITYSVTLPAKDEYRDVLSKIIEAAPEKMSIFQATKEIDMNKMLVELEDLGARLLAIKRGKEWIAVTPYNIEKLEISEGDVLLIMHPSVLEEDLKEKLTQIFYS